MYFQGGSKVALYKAGALYKAHGRLDTSYLNNEGNVRDPYT